MLQRWKITIEYDGTDYHGWQRQEDGIPSIQRSIETAITKFCGQDITITGAGRTDAGVHAYGQIAHFDLDYGDRDLTGFDLAKAINAHLRPQPIAIIHAETVADDFHARFGAKHKTYHYRVITRSAPPVRDLNHVWHMKYDLDVDAMREGAKHLLGHHDFTSFRDSQCQAKSPMRTLDNITITETDYDSHGGKHILFALEAQSFLHHQCRNIVGTLVDVGKQKTNPDDVKTILDAKDRTKAGMTAPASGLSMFKINYQ
jgi:tRNA pseudouridine38-40 synthase